MQQIKRMFDINQHVLALLVGQSLDNYFQNAVNLRDK